ncbi:MAG: hypothetical protein ABI919_04175 [Ramlibacter sp.]
MTRGIACRPAQTTRAESAAATLPGRAQDMHTFEYQQSSQSLANGIAEYFEANPSLAKGRGLSPAAHEFFRCHDAVHVVFGCGTALNEEAVVKIASILGTTGGLGVLRGYRLHESLEIYKKLRVVAVLFSIAQSVFVVPRTIFRCLKQTRRWPWNNFEQYMQIPLREIREEFGIRVAHFHAQEPDT